MVRSGDSRAQHACSDEIKHEATAANINAGPSEEEEGDI